MIRNPTSLPKPVQMHTHTHTHTHTPHTPPWLKWKHFPLRFNEVSQDLLLGHIRAGRSSLQAGEKFCFPSCTHRGILCRHGVGNLFGLAQRPVSTFRKWSQKRQDFKQPAAHECPSGEMPYPSRVPFSLGCPESCQKRLWGWLWTRKGRSDWWHTGQSSQKGCVGSSKPALRSQLVGEELASSSVSTWWCPATPTLYP